MGGYICSMSVTVIIATRNRSAVLAKCLREYEKQTLKDLEIIVADNGSSDDTLEMLRRDFPHIQVLSFKENIGPLALNAAAQAGRGEYLWRTDDDAYPETPTTIEEACRILDANPDLVSVSCEIRAATINFDLLHYYPHRIPEGPEPFEGYPYSTFFGCAALLRRDVFLKAGGFWDAFYYEEDEVSIRMLMLGGRMTYVPRLCAIHLNAFVQARDMNHRWKIQLVQAFRLQWKYWPPLAAAYRSMVAGLVMAMSAVYHRLNVRFVLLSYKDALRAANKAYRHERVRIPSSTLRRVTMNRSIWHRMLHPYWQQYQRRRAAK